MKLLLSSLCLLALTGNYAQAATSWYFHENGTSPGFGIVANNSYSWEDAVWTTSSTGLGTGQVSYATALTASSGNGGVFPRFNSSTTPYTITVPNSEDMSGMFGASGATITFSQVGSGSINIVPNASPTGGLPAQGFFTGGGNLIINAPITGTGAYSESAGGGFVDLFGNNTYSGGTVFNSSGTLTYFNNNSSFGTGPMVINGTTFAPILGTGGSTLTLANNWTNLVAAGVNFAADPNTPVVLTGPVSLLANLNLRNNGNSTSPLTLSGVISGSGGLTLSGVNGGTIIFSGVNTYTGNTTVGASGATAVTLKLGAANTIANTPSLILAGGKLDLGGLNHVGMINTTLGLTASSTVNFSAGNNIIKLANSSGLTWTSGSILNLADWVGSGHDGTQMEFGIDATGLTAAQLADIELDGNASTLGMVGIDSQGFLVIPEPSMGLLSLFGGLGMIWIARRRKV